MAKKDKRKKRNEHIYGTTVGNVSEIVITTNSLTGEISFGSDMINVYSEISYDRPKGPKVLSRIPQADQNLSFDAGGALEKNFDFLCAVDTNTRNIQGKNLSVVGIVTFQLVWVSEKQGLQRYWRHDVPFCLEYVEIKSKPENFGWLAAIEHLKQFGHINDINKIGMAVDSDLGNVNDYNQRKKPIDGPDYLPANIQLIYASADTGKDNIVNKSLSLADSVSSQCLEAVESGLVPFNQKVLDNEWFEGLRIIKPNKVRL
jgi:hypothetical protein